MIQSLRIEAKAAPDWKPADIHTHVENHLIQQMAFRTHKWYHPSKGWRVNIPRHQYNTLTASPPIPHDMLIGSTQITSDGTITATLELGWGLCESEYGEEIDSFLDAPKAELRRRMANEQAYIQANDAWQNACTYRLEIEEELAADSTSEESRERLRDAANAVCQAVIRREEVEREATRDGMQLSSTVNPRASHESVLQFVCRRKSGLYEELLTPHQVEVVVERYVWLLYKNFPFLDPESVRVVSADVYYQWDVPSARAWISHIQQAIIKEHRKGQNVRLDHRVHESGKLNNCKIYHTRLSESQPLKNTIRLSVHLPRRKLSSLELFDFSESAEGGGVHINWPAIINILRARAAEIPVCRYRNDIDLLLDRSVDAKRVVALCDHPDVLPIFVAHGKRPDASMQRLGKYQLKWFDAPLLNVPDFDDLLSTTDDG